MAVQHPYASSICDSNVNGGAVVEPISGSRYYGRSVVSGEAGQRNMLSVVAVLNSGIVNEQLEN